jgi:hypothetical protein
MRALVDIETVIGLTPFTLALGYVVTTVDVLRTLDGLHAIVRRHAEDPSKPSSILARHFRGGQPTELSSLLQSITEKLEAYDQGLRRYPSSTTSTPGGWRGRSLRSSPTWDGSWRCCDGGCRQTSR